MNHEYGLGVLDHYAAMADLYAALALAKQWDWSLGSLGKLNHSVHPVSVARLARFWGSNPLAALQSDLSIGGLVALKASFIKYYLEHP